MRLYIVLEEPKDTMRVPQLDPKKDICQLITYYCPIYGL